MIENEPVIVQSAERPSWQLERAVLIYTAHENDAFGIRERNGHAYATLHKVVTGKGGSRLEAGIPATREACADIARALGANAALCGFLPPNLLFLGTRSIIWWRPPALGRVFFDTSKGAAGDQPGDKSGAALIGKKNGLVPHPGLVFAVGGDKWFVYAVKGPARPVPTDKLWRAPYFNVWASGEICTGNVRLPEALSPQSLAVYERAFFDSEFTHPNARGREKLVAHRGGPYAFWKEMLDLPAGREFPEKHLVETKDSLQRLAKALEKGGREIADD